MANVEVLTNVRPGVAPVKEGSFEGVPLGELESEITAAAGTATLKAEPGAAYEKGQYLISIGEELIVCTLNKKTLTLVTRGAESTTAAVHGPKAQVYNVTTEGQLEKWLEQHRGRGANVLHYGADSTGVEDSTEAFKKAGEAAELIYAPSGTYLIAGTLDVSGKTLEGDGMGNTILTKNGTSSAMLTVKTSLTTTIRGLTLTNSNHEATSGSYIKIEQKMLAFVPILVEEIETKFAFNGIEVVGAGGGAEKFENPLFVTINRIWQYKFKGNAFWYRKGANGVTTRDFYAQEGTTTSVGIRLEGWNPAHIFEGGEILIAGVGLLATIEGGVAGLEHRPENCRFTDVFFDTIYGKKENKNATTTTAGSALVKMTVAGSGVNVGDAVTGTGVPAETTVSEVKLATNEIKLSANIEAGKGGTPTLTFTLPATKLPIVRVAQCFDMRFVNCWVAMNPVTAKVAGFEVESSELIAFTQCIAYLVFYPGYVLIGTKYITIINCSVWLGGEGEYAGGKKTQVLLLGVTQQTSLVGGTYVSSKGYGIQIGPNCPNTDINGPLLVTPALGEVLNEITEVNASSVYIRGAGQEGTLTGAEITSWLSAKVKVAEGSTTRAKVHAGNIQLIGILEAAEEVKAEETFMTAPVGPYRPKTEARRARFAYGKHGVNPNEPGEPPKDVWCEITTGGLVRTVVGSPNILAGEIIYLDEVWYQQATS